MAAVNIESGVQLYSRIRENSCRTVLKYPLFPEGVRTKESIEIVGEYTAANTLLLDFITRSILPKEYHGNETDTIFINTEHNVTIPVLINAMQHVTRGLKVNEKHLIESCLKRLTLLNCYSSNQMKFTFMHLERLLQENEQIKVVIVDSMYTYYWMDKMDLGAVSYQNYCTNTVKALLDIIKDFNITLIYKSINNDLVTKCKGLKRNYIINVLHTIDDKCKLHIVEDDVYKKQVEIKLNVFAVYD